MKRVTEPVTNPTISVQEIWEMLDTRATISVPEAGKIINVGRDASYAAAHAGQIPVIRVGNLMRVPTARFKKMLVGD